MQYFGKNFFLVEFAKVGDRDATLEYALWFYEKKNMYTFPWVLDFDVTTVTTTCCPSR